MFPDHNTIKLENLQVHLNIPDQKSQNILNIMIKTLNVKNCRGRSVLAWG